MEWALKLTANSMDDSETLLRLLPATLARNGSWMLMRTISPEGVVHLCFEFEREACVDIYTVLIAAGLELNRASHVQLTQLCHCSTSREGSFSASHDVRRSFEPVRVDLKILPEQSGVFELKPERGGSDFAYHSHA